MVAYLENTNADPTEMNDYLDSLHTPQLSQKIKYGKN